MSTRLRCSRGHFLPATFQPVGDPADWDDTCRCVLTPKRRRPPRPYGLTAADLYGQGLARRGKPVRLVQLRGSYL